ncbi:HAD family phosphatase [uncultured Roseobacter sp.]|uniref:HAD family hydrolase n=1 Tax=uncultured Roseobacter sp. TaxID=114847 RepID=UPI002601C775|nr:HAD family phosphatase [uncultured Roseobacter sp.]
MVSPVHPRRANLSSEDAATFAGIVSAAKLVIFDFDGVIADSEVISLSTLKSALHQFGVKLSLEETRKTFLGTSLKTITSHVAEHGTGNSENFPDIWESELFARFAGELQPVPHVFDLISRLEQNQMPFCIASSSTFKRLNAALKAMDVADRFHHVFSAEQVSRGKPAPDLFEFAASKMQVDPEDCLVIEDSPHGIRAARSARMRAVGFTGGCHLDTLQNEHGDVLCNAGAEMVLRSFGDFAKLDMIGWRAVSNTAAGS